MSLELFLISASNRFDLSREAMAVASLGRESQLLFVALFKLDTKRRACKEIPRQIYFPRHTFGDV
jgi:hypothetical protein